MTYMHSYRIKLQSKKVKKKFIKIVNTLLPEEQHEHEEHGDVGHVAGVVDHLRIHHPIQPLPPDKPPRQQMVGNGEEVRVEPMEAGGAEAAEEEANPLVVVGLDCGCGGGLVEKP